MSVRARAVMLQYDEWINDHGMLAVGGRLWDTGFRS